MGYRLAVDLGTAFAAAAVVNGSDPAMVGLGNRTMQVPSVLFFAEDHSVVIGEAAERRGTTEPGRLVREFKRRFGDPVPLLVAGAAYSAESLMARLLRWVVAATTTQQGEAPTELILTHPANWGPYKRELLDQVVALADLSPARYCTEPEAAAVKYAARTKVEVGDRIAVYDLGGGTFDVCVLEKRPDGFTVLGTPDGIEHLGGADLDEAMTQLVLGTLAERLDGADLDDPAMTVGLARLRRDCVDAKEALSSETDVAVPVALPGLNTTVRVNRGELEAMMRPALLETVAAVWRTLASARVAPSDLTAIVLVGGSSRIPLVGELLQNEFEVPLSIDTHPKHDIALGAALLFREQRPIPVGPARPGGGDVGPVRPAGSVADPRPTGGDLFGDPDYLAAVSAGFSEQWTAAVSALERVAERYPGQRRVTDRLNRARREVRVAELTDLATRAEVDRRWPDAVDALEELTDLQPGSTELTERLGSARGEAQVEALTGEMRSLYAAGQWRAVLQTGEELRELAADRVPEAMVTGAERELQRIELESRYNEALRQLDDEDWSGAEQSLQAIVETDDSFPGAGALLERIRARRRPPEPVAESPAEPHPTSDEPLSPPPSSPPPPGPGGSSAAPPPWFRRRRLVATAAAGVVLVVVGVIIAVVVTSRPDSSSASRAPGSPTGTASAMTPSPQELLSHVPSDYRGSCTSVETDMRNAAVKLECPIEGSQVTMIYHYQYNSEDAYQRAVSATFTASDSSDCSSKPGQDRYAMTNASGQQRSGLLACEAATPLITFTSSTDQLWVISFAQATYDPETFGFPEMKGSWKEYPLE